MFKQFIDKTYWYVLLGLMATFLLAILVFETPYIVFVLGLFGIGIFFTTLWKLEYGIFILFAELFANSHGHLISTQVSGQGGISLRMVLFVGLMLGWLVLFLSRKVKISFADRRLVPFYILAVAIVLGFAFGAMEDPVRAFKDGNAYLYLAALLPILSVKWDAVRQRQLLQVIAAAASWVILLTLGSLYLFTHLPGEMLAEPYRFLRDTRTGELTMQAGGIFRVFFQSQFTVVIMAFLLVPFLWMKGFVKKTWFETVVAIAFVGAVILISLSRSFWVGSMAGAIAFLILMGRYAWPGWKQAAKSVFSHVLIKVVAVLILVVVVLFPIPPREGSIWDLTQIFSSRSTEISGAAIDSRWKLLDPMVDLIYEAPILGYGFGKEVEFVTDDPRIREQYPDGKWKTYSLEWGWLELWLKMGILGPIAFFYIFYSLMRGLWPYFEGKRFWLGLGLVSSLVMLFVTHAFSPYLNHPLGLGLILFIVPFLIEPKQKGLSVLDKIPRPMRSAKTSPVMTIESRH